MQGQDPALAWSGLLVDDIKVTNGATTVFADGAETSPNGWTLDGFRSVGASYDTAYDQFYLASNRAYVSYDKYLQTGPYNFSFPDRPDFVEKFPYQDGLLVNYWDSSYSDNNTSQHPGGGLVLPIDANPRGALQPAGRRRGADASRPTTRRSACRRSDSFYLTAGGRRSLRPWSGGQPAVRRQRPEPLLPAVRRRGPAPGRGEDGRSRRQDPGGLAEAARACGSGCSDHRLTH